MDFRQLEVFLSVVDAGGFSRAGEKLFLTQPTISSNIAALENELGQRLLERGGKEIRPTEAGKRFYGYARRLLTLRNEALAAMRGEVATCTVDIAASSAPAQYLLPSLIAAYHQLHPEISFNILRADSADVPRRLRSHEAELGFSGSAEPDDGCVYLPLAEDRLALILPDTPEYRALLQTEAPLSALLRMPLISREPGSGTRREFERYLRQHFPDLKPQVIAEMDDPETIKRAVAAGLGVAVLSARAAADYVGFGALLSYPLDDAATRRLYLVQRKKDILSPAAQSFADFVSRQKDV